jgi:hypothetical protein
LDVLKRYVLAGLLAVFAGSAFAEVNVGVRVGGGRAFIPCVAGAFNCTPVIAPVAGGPRPGVGIPPGGIARPLPAPILAPGFGPQPFPAGPGVGVNVNVGVHAGPMLAPLPCGPRPLCPPPFAGGFVKVRIRAGGVGCGLRRGFCGFGRGVRVAVKVRVGGLFGRRFRC